MCDLAVCIEQTWRCVFACAAHRKYAAMLELYASALIGVIAYLGKSTLAERFEE